MVLDASPLPSLQGYHNHRRGPIQSSRLPGFYQLSPEERVRKISDLTGLSHEEVEVVTGRAGLSLERADQMIENTVGVYSLPLGIAVNFRVNGKDYLVPMAIEEPSVVAGASFAARLAREGGGFDAHTTEPEMIGQWQILDVTDPWAARHELLAKKDHILRLADEIDRVIVQLGGGARDLEVRVLETPSTGPMLVAHLIFNCLDAMGANMVNTVLEALAPVIEEITGGRVNLRILSNLADRRLARAKVIIPATALAFEGFEGNRVITGIIEASAQASADPYRAATHNKGIMNGVDAVVIATGNDWRAVEAGAHAYAARDGRYSPLSTWGRTSTGNLVGTLEMPLALGIVGGATRVNPSAQVALKLLGVQTARELAEVTIAVGLAQNLAALRALATEGIQRGHMQLHARQVAMAAGAEGEEVFRVAERLVAEKAIQGDRAAMILVELRRTL